MEFWIISILVYVRLLLIFSNLSIHTRVMFQTNKLCYFVLKEKRNNVYLVRRGVG